VFEIVTRTIFKNKTKYNYKKVSEKCHESFGFNELYTRTAPELSRGEFFFLFVFLMLLLQMPTGYIYRTYVLSRQAIEDQITWGEKQIKTITVFFLINLHFYCYSCYIHVNRIFRCTIHIIMINIT
jgi:hypothetical protein